MHWSSSDAIALSLEQLITQRSDEGDIPSSTLPALKASVWFKPVLSETSCSIVCYLRRAFEWGYSDMARILGEIKHNYMPLLKSRQPYVTVDPPHCPMPELLPPTGFEPLNFGSLASANPNLENALYPTGLDMIVVLLGTY